MLVKGSILLPNEARQRLNWRPIEGLDRPIIPLSNGIILPDGTILSLKTEQKEENVNLKGGDSDESGDSQQLD